MKVIKYILISLLVTTRLYANDYTTWGDINQYTATIFSLGLSLYNDDNEGLKNIAKSYASTIGTSYLLKHTINSKRPNGGNHSFPSAHSASAMSGVGFLYMNYGWKTALPFFIIASSVGHSRIEGNYHRIEDVLAGFAISLGFDYFYNKDSKNYISLINPDRGTWGLSYIRRF